MPHYANIFDIPLNCAGDDGCATVLGAANTMHAGAQSEQALREAEEAGAGGVRDDIPNLSSSLLALARLQLQQQQQHLASTSSRAPVNAQPSFHLSTLHAPTIASINSQVGLQTSANAVPLHTNSAWTAQQQQLHQQLQQQMGSKLSMHNVAAYSNPAAAQFAVAAPPNASLTHPALYLNSINIASDQLHAATSSLNGANGSWTSSGIVTPSQDWMLAGRLGARGQLPMHHNQVPVMLHSAPQLHRRQALTPLAPQPASMPAVSASMDTPAARIDPSAIQSLPNMPNNGSGMMGRVGAGTPPPHSASDQVMPCLMATTGRMAGAMLAPQGQGAGVPTVNGTAHVRPVGPYASAMSNAAAVVAAAAAAAAPGPGSGSGLGPGSGLGTGTGTGSGKRSGASRRRKAKLYAALNATVQSVLAEGCGEVGEQDLQPAATTALSAAVGPTSVQQALAPAETRS